MLEPLGGHLHRGRPPWAKGAFGGGEPAAAILDRAAAAAMHARAEIAGQRLQFGQHRGGHLRSGGGSRRTAIGDEVDERGVGLVADGADQRDRALDDRAGQRLVVERPEVLDRAAAAGHDQDVGPGQGAAGGQGIEAADGGGDLRGRRIALHHHRPDHHAAGPAVADAVQDVADHRPGWAGDDADHRGHGRERPLARRVEQALGAQPGLQPLELRQERADAGGLHGLDDDLVAGAGGVAGDLAGDDHLQALSRGGWPKRADAALSRPRRRSRRARPSASR